MKKVVFSAFFLCAFVACGTPVSTSTPNQELSATLKSNLQTSESQYETKDTLVNSGTSFQGFGDTINRIFYTSNKKGNELNFSYWSFDFLNGNQVEPTLVFEKILLEAGNTVNSEATNSAVNSNSAITGKLTCTGTPGSDTYCSVGSITLNKATGKFSGEVIIQVSEATPSSITVQTSSDYDPKLSNSSTLKQVVQSIKLDPFKSTLQTLQVGSASSKHYQLTVQFKHVAANDVVEAAYDSKMLLISGRVGSADPFRLAFGYHIEKPAANQADGMSDWGPQAGAITDNAANESVLVNFSGDAQTTSILIQLPPPTTKK